VTIQVPHPREEVNCFYAVNGLHRVAAERRLAFESLPFLQGTCAHCGQHCKALKVVGSRWYTDEQFAARYEDYEIVELP